MNLISVCGFFSFVLHQVSSWESKVIEASSQARESSAEVEEVRFLFRVCTSSMLCHKINSNNKKTNFVAFYFELVL